MVSDKTGAICNLAVAICLPLLHWADNLDMTTVVLSSIIIVSYASRDLLRIAKGT